MSFRWDLESAGHRTELSDALCEMAEGCGKVYVALTTDTWLPREVADIGYPAHHPRRNREADSLFS